ncbi:hypothetical protein M441DRAFT_299842 [Trichoderma asperellum CBS 433.97]|uniref:Uncharacterized protein n=1 Tax=Trichoderma asperellum (strain ATCC 204424 / CBS 433.97 / NBRC 101777) TaxID=1042311 RepID=A0A2T3ZJ95_TRIA4|nr:hypothetical protein M441DRAFT_299842 [Trichoderma asperellum CBS 433.97]PTB44852.1 hypothetical protein M441DRAFT_299842 [Trichoderma asperellum CBS 433.97]
MLVLLVPILVEQLQHNCLAKSNCYESESATKRCQRRSKSRLIDKDGTDVTILIDPFHATDHLNQRPFSLAAAVANIFTTYCQWKGEKTTESRIALSRTAPSPPDVLYGISNKPPFPSSTISFYPTYPFLR